MLGLPVSALRSLRNFHGKENQGHAFAVLAGGQLDELEAARRANLALGMRRRHDTGALNTLAFGMEDRFVILRLMPG